jgi:serine/threonine protein kinase
MRSFAREIELSCKYIFRNQNLIEFYSKKCKIVNLKHRNIVEVFGISLSVPNLAIVLEYMRRGSLYNVLRAARQQPVCCYVCVLCVLCVIVFDDNIYFFLTRVDHCLEMLD